MTASSSRDQTFRPTSHVADFLLARTALGLGAGTTLGFMLRNPGTIDVICARIWTNMAVEQDVAVSNYATTEVAQVRTAGDSVATSRTWLA